MKFNKNQRPPIRSLIHLKWKKSLPQLVIHEKFEKKVKWILRILTFLGIIMSLISIPIWYFALLVAIGFYLVVQFFEKAIFQYSSLFIQPIPNFKYDPSEWKAMTYGFPQESNTDELNILGCAFSTNEYATKVFKLFKTWNFEDQSDIDNNICISIIIEDKENYSIYIYPNIERESVDECFKEIYNDLKLEKYGKEQQQLVFQFIFCKTFPLNDNSLVNTFIKKQPKDRPYYFRPFLLEENGNLNMLGNELSIIKYHIKIKNRNELTEEEIEYSHGKNLMGK